MTTSATQAPRSVDHCVLSVADLAAAQARLARLGFTLAPEARHPFGTRNACVFFADGTYLEPLAIAEREACEAAERAGNVMIARDHAFRFRNGGEGFYALAFASPDATADDADFRGAGISGGPTLAFERPFRTPEGRVAEASFRLAFAADPRAPDMLLFVCQRVQMPVVDRGELASHENSVTGIAEIALVEQNPADFQYYLQSVVRQRDVEAHSFGITLASANAAVTALTPAGMEAFFGHALALPTRGLRLCGIVFTASDLTVVERRLKRNAVAFQRHGGRIVVPAEPGQGAIFAFEEAG